MLPCSCPLALSGRLDHALPPRKLKDATRVNDRARLVEEGRAGGSGQEAGDLRKSWSAALDTRPAAKGAASAPHAPQAHPTSWPAAQPSSLPPPHLADGLEAVLLARRVVDEHVLLHVHRHVLARGQLVAQPHVGLHRVQLASGDAVAEEDARIALRDDDLRACGSSGGVVVGGGCGSTCGGVPGSLQRQLQKGTDPGVVATGRPPSQPPPSPGSPTHSPDAPSATGACSRDEPQPKFSPPMMTGYCVFMLPSDTNLQQARAGVVCARWAFLCCCHGYRSCCCGLRCCLGLHKPVGGALPPPAAIPARAAAVRILGCRVCVARRPPLAHRVGYRSSGRPMSA